MEHYKYGYRKFVLDNTKVETVRPLYKKNPEMN